ncbi:hypothetical protein HJC23_005687 [Cyclotella cryptica]|uniref:Uncharacterized protein n=1 Tax=Cyclotella cryptica TaxID=29204 RepID=A0ABD3PD60_9STRA
MQEAISSAQRRGDEARAQVAATLGVYEPHPHSSRRQRSTRYGAAAAELFEREFGGGGHGGAHVGSHTGNENNRQNHGGGSTRVIVDAHGRIIRAEGGGVQRRHSRVLPNAVAAAVDNPPPLLATPQQNSQQQQTQHQPAPQQQHVETMIAPVMPAGPPLLDQAQIAADVRDVLRSRISKRAARHMMITTHGLSDSSLIIVPNSQT